MDTNDNFNKLWEGFKASLGKARTKNDAVYTLDGIGSRWGGRISIGSFDDGQTPIHVSRGGFSGVIYAGTEDLVTIAAQCMAEAERMTAGSITDEDVHAAMFGRFPSTDEQAA